MAKQIKITQSELKHLIKESVTQALNEISKSDKNKLVQNGYNIIDNSDDNIRTFCIITGENPMGIDANNRENRNNQKLLTDYLKQGNFAWLPIRGKYNSTENPKMIFNIRVADAKLLGLETMQESFIFGRKESGKVYFDLYYINAEQKDYDLVETKDYVLNDIQNSTNMYSIINNKRKFNFPFTFFNECCNSFNGIINEHKKSSDKYNQNFQRYLNESLDCRKTYKSCYMSRSLIYGGLFK